MPGRVTVTTMTLDSVYSATAEARQLNPVISLFDPRVDERSWAQFTIFFSYVVETGETLRISSIAATKAVNDLILTTTTSTTTQAGYSAGTGAYILEPEAFVVNGVCEQGTTIGGFVCTVESKGQNAIEATLGVPTKNIVFQANTEYSMSMWVTPKAGRSSWLIETLDGGALPTNTNDALDTRFNSGNPVTALDLKARAIRAPPGAEIDVNITVKFGANVMEYVLYAPKGFSIPAGGCGAMCYPGLQHGESGRYTMMIRGETVLTKTKYKVRVKTPTSTPTEADGGIEWFVVAKGADGRTNGWGRGMGFEVRQMIAHLRYPGVANIFAQLTASFRNTIADVGARIVVTGPPDFGLTCSTEGALRAISLPGGNHQCEGEEGNTLTILLNETLMRDIYAFGIMVQVPAQTPTNNDFSIQILDRKLVIHDGAYGIPGVDIRNYLIKLPYLSWQKSEPNQATIITAGITFDEDVEWVRAILFTFPETIIHDVVRMAQIKSMNRKFPLPSDGIYADTSDYKYIKVYTAQGEGAGLITADVYKWNFPVMLPGEMPRENVWYISLCDDRSCRVPTDNTVMVHFPVAGFRMGERSPEDIEQEGSLAALTGLLLVSLLGASS